MSITLTLGIGPITYYEIEHIMSGTSDEEVCHFCAKGEYKSALINRVPHGNTAIVIIEKGVKK